MLMLFGWATASAQTYTLRGTAIDFHDNTALNKVKIEVAGKTVFSDSDGKFLITKIKAGRYLITATHPDCEVFSENIVIKEDTEITLNLASNYFQQAVFAESLLIATSVRDLQLKNPKPHG